MHLLLETALIVVVADSFVAVAALAVAAWLKRNPAAAHCVLALCAGWILVTPLGRLGPCSQRRLHRLAPRPGRGPCLGSRAAFAARRSRG